jgi:hypothetical protein
VVLTTAGYGHAGEIAFRRFEIISVICPSQCLLAGGQNRPNMPSRKTERRRQLRQSARQQQQQVDVEVGSEVESKNTECCRHSRQSEPQQQRRADIAAASEVDDVLERSEIDVVRAMENCDPALVVAWVTGMAKLGIRLSDELARSVMGWAECCHNLLVLLDDPVWDAFDNDCAVYYCCWGTQNEAASARAGPEIGRAGGGGIEVSRVVNYDRIAADILQDGSLGEKTTDFLVAKMGQAADENWDLEHVEDFLWGSVSPCDYDPEAEALIDAWLKGATRP